MHVAKTEVAGTTIVHSSLSDLPRAEAAAFATRLYAPGERFARAFYYYWRVVLGHSELEARLRTREELEGAAQTLLEHLDDANYRVVVTSDGQPIALYGFRPIGEHPVGRQLTAVIKANALQERYPSPLAFAHAVSILDSYSSLSLLKSILISIGCAALDGQYQRVLFFTSDHRLRVLYRRFGMEFPSDLALPGSQHLVGMYNPWDETNALRMHRVALGRTR